MNPRRRRRLIIMVGIAWLLGSCASDRPANHIPPGMDPENARAFIEHRLPPTTPDRRGWSADIDAAFRALSLPASRENSCAVLAVIAQESGFRVDPVIPDLGAIAWKEIDSRALDAGIPRAVVHGVLRLSSSNGRSYAQRIDNAHTEHELSDIYEDFIGRVPLGHSLFEDHNPIRTRGPMQVHVAFATQFAATRSYPYPIKTSIDDELFTRRGSVYFGVAHLLSYSAPYDKYLYRFADFNAGQYASRNAAFQRAVTAASGIALVPDGALLPHDGDDAAGSTELAVRSLGPRLDISAAAIHAALVKGRTQKFESEPLYTRVFALAERAQGHPLPRAAIPQIRLQGPKITRKLTTEWYAERVDGRYQACLK